MAEKHEDPEVKEISIHLHEHFAGLRERLSGVETSVKYHDKEIGVLHNGIKSLSDKLDSVEGKVDGMKVDIVRAMDNSKTMIYDLLDEHTTADEIRGNKILERIANQEELITQHKIMLTGYQKWGVGLIAGFGALWTLIEVLDRTGLTHYLSK